MAQHEAEAVTFRLGDQRTLPHTLARTRHLMLTLIEYDEGAGTAIFELHNPEAEPNEMVGALIEENAENVERANERRDRFHLPEKTVPVDTSTMAVESIPCRLGERLQIGDRLWTVTNIDSTGVTLIPGRDNEAHNLINDLEDVEYTTGVRVAEGLNTIDEAF